MFSVLVRKEWRQLTMLRWVGLGLGVLLPPLLLASAEAARSGWFPFQHVSSYSVETLFLEIQPAFLLALAALISTLVSCQCFSGDRAAGTETFLLERPVGRPSIWSARLLATAATTTLVVAGHVAVWLFFARSAAETGGPLWPQAVRLLELGLPAIVVVTIAAGLAAASVLDSPLQAVMLAVVLGIAPMAAGALLAGLFPFAMLRGVPCGPIVSLVLLGGYLVASYRMLCRGEPAGRGRLWRGAAVLGIALVLAPVSFLLAAPVAMRLESRRWVDGARLFPAPAGSLAVAHNERSMSGWLIDTASGRRVRFFDPPVYGYLWNANGSRLVVVRGKGRLGRVSAEARADFFDGAGRAIGSVSVDPQPAFVGLQWVGDRLAARLAESRERSSLWIVRPESGEVTTIEFPLGASSWKMLGPADGGQLYVARARSSAWPQDPVVLLQRVDVERGALDPHPVAELETPASGLEVWGWLYRLGMSPGGRYLEQGRRDWVDLGTLESYSLEGRGWTGWLADDELVWLDPSPGGGGRLYLGPPGGPGALLRSWESGALMVDLSPDRERLFIRSYASAADDDAVGIDGAPIDPQSRLRGLWIYERRDGSWSDASGWVGAPATFSDVRVAWAGPRMLALSGAGWLGLHDLAPDSGLRLVDGSRPAR